VFDNELEEAQEEATADDVPLSQLTLNQTPLMTYL
jgi:hypothetical protein